VVADSGIGWPDGYPGAAAAEPQPVISRRDRELLSLANALRSTTLMRSSWTTG
jgi:hypothetical protein